MELQINRVRINSARPVVLSEEYTPPLSDFEANSPGPTQDMAIVIDDEEDDGPLCPPGQNLDVVDLTKDTDMVPTSQPESANVGERKRKSQWHGYLPPSINWSWGNW